MATTLYDICVDVNNNFPNFPLQVLKNGIAVALDSINVPYKKDVSFVIKYMDKIIGEDICDFLLNGVPCIVGSSTAIGFSEKSLATKIIRCISEFNSPTGLVIIFKANDMYYQPVIIREYNSDGSLKNEFAGRISLM